MRSLTVLSCILTAATACVPTKTPEPGIPAVTPMPSGPKCPSWPANCVNAIGVTCDQNNPPMITPTMMSCAGGKNLIILQTGAGGVIELRRTALTATCMADGFWHDQNGSKLNADPPGYTACSI